MKTFKQYVKEVADACQVCGQTPCNCTHVTEGLADDFLKMAHEKGYKNARIVTADQKRKETAELLQKRADERKKNPPPPPKQLPRKTGFRSGAEDDTYGT